MLFLVSYFFIKTQLKREYFLNKSKNKRKFFIIPIIWPKKFFKKEDIVEGYVIYIAHIIFLILGIWLFIKLILNLLI